MAFISTLSVMDLSQRWTSPLRVVMEAFIPLIMITMIPAPMQASPPPLIQNQASTPVLAHLARGAVASTPCPTAKAKEASAAAKGAPKVDSGMTSGAERASSRAGRASTGRASSRAAARATRAAGGVGSARGPRRCGRHWVIWARLSWLRCPRQARWAPPGRRGLSSPWDRRPPQRPRPRLRRRRRSSSGGAASCGDWPPRGWRRRRRRPGSWRQWPQRQRRCLSQSLHQSLRQSLSLTLLLRRKLSLPQHLQIQKRARLPAAVQRQIPLPPYTRKHLRTNLWQRPRKQRGRNQPAQGRTQW
mmetsp:Transcript_13599/g.21551  ORF Transcript_13599/g.21551 Transcript_13599/m.21551 type:complete len:302 (-) Transcript_13599:1958-2863(-)